MYDLTHSLFTIDCFGKFLNKKKQQLQFNLTEVLVVLGIKNHYVNAYMYTQLDPATMKCSLTNHSRQLVLVSLLSELVFLKGQNRTLSLSALPTLYRSHFGCHLSPASFGVKKIVGLFQLPKIKPIVSAP